MTRHVPGETDADISRASASQNDGADRLIVRRRERISTLFAHLSAARTASAVDCFAEDALVMRVVFFDGRVAGAHSVARGRSVIHEWLSALVERNLTADVTSCAAEEDALVVRYSWSFDGFHGERVHATGLGLYEFEGDRIVRLRLSSLDDEGEGCRAD